jgi:hypothetical protein
MLDEAYDRFEVVLIEFIDAGAAVRGRPRRVARQSQRR